MKHDSAAHLLVMTTDANRRIHKSTGAPDGGQYAVEAKTAPTTTLTPTRLALKETSRGVFQVVNATSEEVEHGGPVRQIKFHMGGKADLRAQSHVAALRMERAEQTDAIHGKVAYLADRTSKVSMIIATPNGDVDVREGTLKRGEHGGLVLMNKGSSTKGVRLNEKARILGVEPGYGKAQALAADFDTYRADVPELEPATFDGIPDCGDDEPPSDIAAVYVFDHPGFEPSQDGRGSVFFVTDFMPGDGDEGIVNGYGVYPGDSGLASEHGSMYAGDLKRWGGRVKGYQAGSHTFTDAIAFGRAADRENDIEACWSSVRAACM